MRKTADIIPLPRKDSAAPEPKTRRVKPRSRSGSATTAPTPVQLAWLQRGLREPGGKLPLFDEDGKRVDARTIKACIDQGWAQPWFANPLKPDWLICRLTEAGRSALARD